jgi:hypothetical protein
MKPFPIPELPCLELTLLDLLRQFDSANRDHRVVESFEPQHRPNPLFDSPVVLFDEIVRRVVCFPWQVAGEELCSRAIVLTRRVWWAPLVPRRAIFLPVQLATP